MDISWRTWLLTILVFLVAGIGLMVLVTGTAENRAKECSIQCKAEGKLPVFMPPGTMGQTVETGSSSSDWRIAFENCRCVASSTGVTPPKQ